MARIPQGREERSNVRHKGRGIVGEKKKFPLFFEKESLKGGVGRRGTEVILSTGEERKEGKGVHVSRPSKERDPSRGGDSRGQ